MSLKSVSGASGGTGDQAIQFNPLTGYANDGTFTLALTALVNLGEFSLSYAVNEGTFPGPQIQWSWTNSVAGYGSSTKDIISVGWESDTVDFAGSSLSAGQTITFTMQLVNDHGYGNNVAFDNLIVSAVPEPVNAALLIFGVGLAAVPTGRRIYLWARA
jgi:hypothetical protein